MAVNVQWFCIKTNTVWCDLRDFFQGRKEVADDQTLAKPVAWRLLVSVKT